MFDWFSNGTRCCLYSFLAEGTSTLRLNRSRIDHFQGAKTARPQFSVSSIDPPLIYTSASLINIHVNPISRVCHRNIPAAVIPIRAASGVCRHCRRVIAVNTKQFPRMMSFGVFAASLRFTELYKEYRAILARRAVLWPAASVRIPACTYVVSSRKHPIFSARLEDGTLTVAVE